MSDFPPNRETREGSEVGLRLGRGHYFGFYWFWVDDLSKLRLVGVSAGSWFIGVAQETR